MTDQQRFFQWLSERKDQLAPPDREEVWNAALSIGRKERTRHIVAVFGQYRNAYPGNTLERLDASLMRLYPECFEKGEG